MSIHAALDFKPMFITDIFDTVRASKAWYDKSKLEATRDATFPFVSRTKAGNGVDGFCSRQEKSPEPGNAITIGLDTQTIGYQPAAFYTSQNIQVLRHTNLNRHAAAVLCTLIGHQMVKFSWGGNGATLGRLKRTRILVPVTTSGGRFEVDWDGMEQLGAELAATVANRSRQVMKTDSSDSAELPNLDFQPMFITDVFETYRQAPSWLNTNQVIPGKPEYPHVTNTALSNSVAGFIGVQDQPPNPGNAITLGIDTQVVAYQPAPFYGGTKVFELRSPMLNQENAVVAVASLKRAVEKFSWGHKASGLRLLRTRLMLPVVTGDDGSAEVDWEGMTQYGRALRVRAERNFTSVI